LRRFLLFVSEWSALWLLEFSISKTKIIEYSRKRYDSACRKNMLLCRSALSASASMKYLGITFNENCSSGTHCEELLAKCKQTAYFIGRITNRFSAPSPLVIARLVRAILIPQLTYGFALLNLNQSFFNKANQVLAAPLRKSLGLGRHASAIRVLWEFGVPDASTLYALSCIQMCNRSHHALKQGPGLPSLLAQDVAAYGSSKPHRHFSSAADLFIQLQRKHALPALPLSRKQLLTISSSIATKSFQGLATASATRLKPGFAVARYLQCDDKPAVCIRARCRLGVATTPARLFTYKKRPTSLCEHCGVHGDVSHVLIDCPVHEQARALCKDALLRLYTPVHFNLDIALGHAPPVPKSLSKEKQFCLDLHDQCLAITSVFLVAVSKRLFL